MTSAGITYEGLVLTTIKLGGNQLGGSFLNGETVTFSETDGNERVSFVKGIEEEDATDGIRRFRGKYVGVDMVKKELKDAAGAEARPLFYVHGWNMGSPGKLLGVEMKDALERCRGKGLYPIPVMWPDESGSFLRVAKDYDDEMDNAIEAGKLLREFVQEVGESLFEHKSLMCHSMGNQVLFNGALQGLVDETSSVKFDNIFLVAAVLPADVFSVAPEDQDFQDTQAKARNLARMVEGRGNIYVLHAWKDWAVSLGSSVCNFTRRFCGKRYYVGRLGADGATNIDPIFGGVVVNEDVGHHLRSLFRFRRQHNYHWEPWAVEFYSRSSIVATAAAALESAAPTAEVDGA